MRTLFLLVALTSVPFGLRAQSAPDLSAWQPAAQALRATPVPMAGYTRFNLPRTDISVVMRGVPLAVSLVQGGWVGFAGDTANAVLLGDLVLLPSEVGAVQVALEARGIGVSALHNHLAGESPALVYLHVAAIGPATRLAAQLDTVFALTALPRAASPAPAVGSIDSAEVFGALQLSGRTRGAVAQAAPILIRAPITWRGRLLPAAMVAASPINLQRIAPDRLVSSGDFALLDEQLPRVLSALTAHGITITAVHSHLTGEQPRLSYVHFWADGTPAAVLAGLRSALEAAQAPS